MQLAGIKSRLGSLWLLISIKGWRKIVLLLLMSIGINSVEAIR